MGACVCWPDISERRAPVWSSPIPASMTSQTLYPPSMIYGRGPTQNTPPFIYLILTLTSSAILQSANWHADQTKTTPGTAVHFECWSPYLHYWYCVDMVFDIENTQPTCAMGITTIWHCKMKWNDGHLIKRSLRSHACDPKGALNFIPWQACSILSLLN